MKKIFTLVFISLITVQIDAQKKEEKSTHDSEYQNTGSQRYADGMGIRENRRDKGDMIGSPYINEYFLQAQIDADENVNVRYNAHKDEMEYTKDNQTYILFPIANKSVVTIKSPLKKYFYLDYKDGKNFKTGYLVEVFNSDKYNVYKKEIIKFTPGVAPKTSYDRQTPDQYRQSKDEFYIQIDGNDIVNLPSNKKNFAKLFGENEKLVATYLKENDVNLNDENSIKKIFQYINSNLK